MKPHAALSTHEVLGAPSPSLARSQISPCNSDSSSPHVSISIPVTPSSPAEAVEMMKHMSRTGSTIALKSMIALVGEENMPHEDEEITSSVILQEKDKATAMIHLYRAEVGRLATYRTRLDNTTNWCISMVGVLSTFSISQQAVPHWFFGLVVILIMFFLVLESRRYVIFDLVKHRARLMEIGFFNQAFAAPPSVAWETALYRSYINVMPRLSLRDAIFVRLQRVYFVLLLVVYLAWVTKGAILHDEFPYVWFGIMTSLMVALCIVLIASFWRKQQNELPDDLDV